MSPRRMGSGSTRARSRRVEILNPDSTVIPSPRHLSPRYVREIFFVCSGNMVPWGGIVRSDCANRWATGYISGVPYLVKEETRLLLLFQA